MYRNFFTAFVITACLATTAQAQSAIEVTSARVFYGDLDLAKPAGMQTLMSRLKAASLRVCGNSSGERRGTTNDSARCAQDAVANALAAVSKAQNRVLANNEAIR